MTAIYTRDDLIRVRCDEVRECDLLAQGRSLELGGYTATRVGLSGPVGFKADWQEEVWRIELDGGMAYQAPGRYPILIVAEGAVR
ncbi:hypothetical protein ABGB07_36290 [Micromonosporaceae bacterium B7E4]